MTNKTKTARRTARKTNARKQSAQATRPPRTGATLAINLEQPGVGERIMEQVSADMLLAAAVSLGVLPSTLPVMTMVADLGSGVTGTLKLQQGDSAQDTYRLTEATGTLCLAYTQEANPNTLVIKWFPRAVAEAIGKASQLSVLQQAELVPVHNMLAATHYWSAGGPRKEITVL